MRIRGRSPSRDVPYEFGIIPLHVVQAIGRGIVHSLAVGQPDLTGDEFSRVFADSIGGKDHSSPLGIADVSLGNCGWSVKTVKDKKPYIKDSVRAISGRNSPDYSWGISDPRADVQLTGDAVLGIWNARVDKAMSELKDLRTVVLVRNMERLEFLIFEVAAERYVPSNYKWSVNKAGNFEAQNSRGEHKFTWQPHGAQFTTILDVPLSATRFQIDVRPGAITRSEVLDLVGFEDAWIKIIKIP